MARSSRFFPLALPQVRGFSKSSLHDSVQRGFYSSTVLRDLYVKRSDAYLKADDWHNAVGDFHRASNGLKRFFTADRWRPIGAQNNSQLDNDMQTFDDSSRASMTLWTKEAEGSTDSSNSYSLDQYEFNCPARQLRTISFARYSAAGNLLASRGEGKWESSIPDTLGETLLNDICKQPK